jgi:ribose 5-phosphate isomerase A
MESDKDVLKRQAAEAAAALVCPGMAVGLGTGSTAAHLVAVLIRRWREEGLRFVAVPTSERTAAQAAAGGLALTDLAAHPALDLTIDGADQIELRTLNLIKGMGGALLREKIVAAASDALVIIADDGKLADRLCLPVPVEVVRFGWQATDRRIRALGAATALRRGPDGGPYITDGGDLILDADFGAMADPGATDRALRDIVGVIESGLFIGRARQVFLAGADGVRHLERP